MQIIYKILLLVAIPVLSYTTVFSIDKTDPVIEYYLKKVDSVLDESHIFNPYFSYNVEITSVYSSINYRGKEGDSDTAVYKVYIDNARVDSSQVIDSTENKKNILPEDFHFERPWNMDCSFHFFPNDTGAGDLAVGFDSRNREDNDILSGLMIVDRDSYVLKSIYLYYQNLNDYERLQKIYKFHYVDSRMTLKTLTIQGTFYDYLMRKYFTQFLIFNNYQFD